MLSFLAWAGLQRDRFDQSRSDGRSTWLLMKVLAEF